MAFLSRVRKTVILAATYRTETRGPRLVAKGIAASAARLAVTRNIVE